MINLIITSERKWLFGRDARDRETERERESDGRGLEEIDESGRE